MRYERDRREKKEQNYMYNSIYNSNMMMVTMMVRAEWMKRARKEITVVPLVLHHSHNALPPKMHRVWRWQSWSKGNYIGIMHNLPNCIMHEDLGHPKTEYAFWEVLIWCHNPAISSIFCIESDQMSGMYHKHSIKSLDRPNILIKCSIRHAVTLNTSCI